MRILIAEDDQVLADGLLRTLRASGAAVDHVASGSEADAALMTTDEFDLLILDLGLPKMHGLEVLKRMRSRGSSMPVLILTAADSVEERVKGLDYGADDYMAKPFSLQELEARVRALIAAGPLTFANGGLGSFIVDDVRQVHVTACAHEALPPTARGMRMASVSRALEAPRLRVGESHVVPAPPPSGLAARSNPETSGLAARSNPRTHLGV